MITKKDAIAAGKAICTGLSREQTKPELQGPDNQARYAARGVALYAMDNLWYDVLPGKVRLAFQYSKDAFFEACDWPV
ncbi:hypothetical protein [Burkholderia cepacia]|uniref:hypothetical protein n=1 Tax=Burkholderia cepacia TaxID=292 RepID=UPI002AB78A32|nr:hypothetical protein [Burkholderia cepacia]